MRSARPAAHPGVQGKRWVAVAGLEDLVVEAQRKPVVAALLPQAVVVDRMAGVVDRTVLERHW